MLLTKVNWKEDNSGHPVMQTVPLALWDPFWKKVPEFTDEPI